MANKISSREEIESFSLPSHAQSYKVIPHAYAIENTIKILNENNFQIDNEIYKTNKEGGVMQAIFHISQNNQIDSEIGMMFAFANSYDKTTRFKCAIGAYVFVCDNGMISGDINYSRKHIGNADIEVIQQIKSQISNASSIFTNIANDKNEIKKISLNQREQAELAGRLFYEKEIITANQMSIIKYEFKNPSYNYNVDSNNLWSFYNHVTHALKKDHPRNWIEASQDFHKFIVSEFLTNSQVNNLDSDIF